MSVNSFKLPFLNIQSLGTFATSVKSIATSNQAESSNSSPADRPATQSDAEKSYQGMNTSTLFKSQIEEYYRRGINILQP